MIEEWPWKGSSLNAYQLLLWNHSIAIKDCPQSCILTTEVIGEECLVRTGPTYDKWVGKTPWKWVLSFNETNLTWQPKKPTWYWASSPPSNGSQCYKSLTNHSLLNCSPTNEENPFRGIPEIGKYWDHLTSTAPGWWKNARWVILDIWKMGLLQTPSHLDRKLYCRDCPAWVLPFAHFPRRTTGVPLFEILEIKTKRSVSIGGNQRWGKDEWPP
jgi:hypothetical protein